MSNRNEVTTRYPRSIIQTTVRNAMPYLIDNGYNLEDEDKLVDDMIRGYRLTMKSRRNQLYYNPPHMFMRLIETLLQEAKNRLCLK